MYWRVLRQVGSAGGDPGVVALRARSRAASAALTLVPPKPDVFLGVSDRGTTEEFNEFAALTGKHPALLETFHPWGNSLNEAYERWRETGTRPILHISTADDQTLAEIITPEQIALGRRRRLPAAAQHLLRDPRAARLHPAAGRAEPLPQRLVGGQLRRHPARRRTHDLLVQTGLPPDRRDRPRRPDPGRDQRDPGRNRAAAAEPDQGPNPPSLPAAPVSMIWSPLPGGSPRVKGNFPGNYWPGSRWVDWVGTDFYSEYPVWEDLNRFYAGKQWKNKPVAMTEWAVSGKDEPRFVKQVISWVVKRPRVRMLVYYSGFGRRQHLRPPPLPAHDQHPAPEDPPRQLPLLRRIQRRPLPPAAAEASQDRSEVAPLPGEKLADGVDQPLGLMADLAPGGAITSQPANFRR